MVDKHRTTSVMHCHFINVCVFACLHKFAYIIQVFGGRKWNVDTVCETLSNASATSTAGRYKMKTAAVAAAIAVSQSPKIKETVTIIKLCHR